MKTLSHGLMLLLGVAVWHALPGERAADSSEPPAPTRSLTRQNPDTRARAWVDATVSKLRQAELEAAEENKKPASMADFLRKTREESASYWQDEQKEIDDIIARARAMGPLQDASAALFAALRTKDDTDELILFQRWMDADPEAALLEMESNWSLLKQYYLPALLRRKFGMDWVKSMAADEDKSLRLRRALANELARQSARGEGLAAFIDFYQAVPDLDLKLDMAWQFADEWPLDEPQAVARALSGNVPKELLNFLMKEWARMPAYKNDSWEEAWMKELHERLGIKPYEVADTSSLYEEYKARLEARQSMSYEEIIQDVMREGAPRQNAAAQAIQIRLDQALAQRPDLVESFAEGRLTRSGLLEELHRMIPGAASDADLLERQVWKKAAWSADPQEITRWAAELARRGDIDDLLKDTFLTYGTSGDPRMPLRLERYRILTKGIPSENMQQRLLGNAAWEWTRWHAASPATAEAWRDGLSEKEPLLIQIREKQAAEERQRENP